MEGVIGYVTPFAGNFAPMNWAFCQGQTINIASNTALFSILGTVYGGNGTTTFALPNLNGRVIIGAGQGPGLSQYSLGQMSGTETATLNITQMPAHIHPVAIVAADNGTENEASSSAAAGSIYARDINALSPYSPAPNVTMASYPATITMTPTGGNSPFGILRPLLGLNQVICLRGVYPARN